MQNGVNERIKSVILHYGLTERAFSIKLGVPQMTINSLFKRDSVPSYTILNAIAKCFNEVSTQWLLTGDGSMFISSPSAEIEIEDSPIKKSSKLLENIIAIRNKRNYTQEQVAAYINMSQSGYALIERGERGLQFELLERIALLYDMDVVDIIKYPDIYVKKNSKCTRVLVELDVEEDELIKMGFKDKVIQVLNK